MNRLIFIFLVPLFAGLAWAQTPVRFDLDNVSNGQFTEGFDVDSSNWVDAAFSPLDYSATGGNPSGRVSNSVEFSGDMQALFRGHASLNASGGNFAGDWVAEGIDTISFDVWHEYSQPVNFFARIATAANFPAHVAIGFAPVLPNQWTTVSIDIREGSPALTNEGAGAGFTYADTFSSVGNLQLGVHIVPEPSSWVLAGLALTGWLGLRRR